jgi:AcrR family transcriptional regulator
MPSSKKTRSAAEGTRKSILKAAKALFVKQGFAGTAISQIAKRAQVNQSLIYHHFDSKENLWRLVKAEIVERFKKEINAVLDDPHLTAKQLVRRFLRLRIEMGIAKPEIQKMFFWQHIEGNTLLRYLPGYDLTRWLNLIEHFQKQGDFRQDLSPRMIWILMSAPANGLLTYIHDLEDAKTRQNCIDVAEEMLCHALLTFQAL